MRGASHPAFCALCAEPIDTTLFQVRLPTSGRPAHWACIVEAADQVAEERACEGAT